MGDSGTNTIDPRARFRAAAGRPRGSVVLIVGMILSLAVMARTHAASPAGTGAPAPAAAQGGDWERALAPKRADASPAPQPSASATPAAAAPAPTATPASASPPSAASGTFDGKVIRRTTGPDQSATGGG